MKSHPNVGEEREWGQTQTGGRGVVGLDWNGKGGGEE